MSVTYDPGPKRLRNLRRRGRLGDLRTNRIPDGERGNAIVELAFALPVALVVLTGFLSFVVFINNNLELANATSIAGQYLALSRSTAGAADPCDLLVKAFGQVSPTLYQTKTFTIKFGGNPLNPYTGVNCSAAAPYMTQSATALITVTYPCNLSFYGRNLVPSCVLTSQVTEIIQ